MVEREKDGMLTVYGMVLMGDNTAGGAIIADEERESGPIRRQSQASADRKHNSTQPPQLSPPVFHQNTVWLVQCRCTRPPQLSRETFPRRPCRLPDMVGTARPIKLGPPGIATRLSVDGETGY